ncbi:MAG TPA: hypothetical protein VMS81_08470 [Methanomicrobiales archaeon]|nr:hypothetical protein [Methanomicrobiales archaeon]
MARNPVIEKLIKGAVERCRERIALGKKKPGEDNRNGEQARKETRFTNHMKQSHGL